MKGIGAGVVASATLSGAASAGDTGDERRQDSFTWANDVLYEMLESEPQDLTSDDEGDDEAHRPIWFVAPQDPDGHSPHFSSPSLTGDHVIDLEPGTRFFSAQWHLHLVLNENGALAESVDGEPLTNADVIRDNAGDGEPLTVVPVNFVFTCPVRPHKHGRS